MKQPIIIVSGLPRSGTSLMMQMLQAGGLPALTDNIRHPDENNPNGYFEWAPIKGIAKDNSVITPAVTAGKAVKVIATLLPKLPTEYDYKVIYMRREITEVMRSQQKMLESTGQKFAGDYDALTANFKQHDLQIRTWLRKASHMQELSINHGNLLKAPEKEVGRIVDFIGASALPNWNDMSAVIDTKLHRNKSAKKSWWRFGFS